MSCDIGIDNGEQKRTREDEEEKKSSSSPPAHPPLEQEEKSEYEYKKPGKKGSPLTLNVQDEESAIHLVSEHFGLCSEHGRAVVQECRKLLPDDPAIFFSRIVR
ncbi:hypothetical protein ACA910_021159 [Epithemia clementina (nom. ined.)]